MKSTTSRKRSSTTKAAAGLTASQKNAKAKTLKKAYVLRVALSDDNEIYSDILIRADQTFEELHEIIFEAFNRAGRTPLQFRYRRDTGILAGLRTG